MVWLNHWLKESSSLQDLCWWIANCLRCVGSCSSSRYRPDSTAYHETSPLQLVCGNPPSISHLRKFGCAVYIPISSPQRTSMRPHRKLEIYVGYSSPSIIKYLEPLTGDLFTARFADCIFNEDHFPALEGELYQKECQKIDWNVEGISFSDPCTTKTKLQVQRIIDLQNIANNLPDTFSNYKGVTKSLHPARNVLERVEVPNKTKLATRGGEALPRGKMWCWKTPRGHTTFYG